MSKFLGLVVPATEPPYLHEFNGYLEIQAKVGGTFDVFTVETVDGKPISVYCDDEGLYHDGAMNRIATNFRGYPILGDVVVAGGVDQHGEQLSVDPGVAVAIAKRVESWTA